MATGDLGAGGLRSGKGSHGDSSSRLTVDVPVDMSSAPVDHLVHLYVDQGMSTYRIARHVGIDRQRVARILHDAGVAVSPRGRNRRRPRRADSPTEQQLRTLYVDLWLPTPAIARILGVPERRVRAELLRLGIDRRRPGGWVRQDRRHVDRDDLFDLYVRNELPATLVGKALGVSGQIVIRAAHSHGLPVRAGGAGANRTADVRLIEALYDDALVAGTLRGHRVPIVRAAGAIWERFPEPVRLDTALLHALYVTCGLSSFQIELVTGQPSMSVLRALDRAGIERRGRGGVSPFLARWRRGARP